METLLLLQSMWDLQYFVFLDIWMSCHLSVIPWGSYDRTWCNHQNPSYVGSQNIPLFWGSIVDPWSWDGRRPWSSRFPPCRSDICSDGRPCQRSHCWSHRNDPGSSCPHRRLSWIQQKAVEVQWHAVGLDDYKVSTMMQLAITMQSF